MASVVAICNLALGHLGDRATLTSIDPPEGSSQADHCAQFWPLARDEALSACDWRFASRTATLARLDDSLQDNPTWRYAFALPADLLVARELVYSSGFVFASENVFLYGSNAPRFELGTLDNGTVVLYSNELLTALRYTRRVTDPTKYTPMLTTGLSYLMASFLAGPVLKGKTGAGASAAMRQSWDMYMGKAAMSDANQTRKTTTFKPSSIRARGYTSGGETYEDGQYRRELPYWAQG